MQNKLVSCLLYVRVSLAVSKQGFWTGKDEVVSTCGLREPLMTKVIPPAFCAGPPCRAGEGEDRVPRRSQVGHLGLVTAGRSQVYVSSTVSMLLSWMKVDMSDLLLEMFVGPPPGSVCMFVFIQFSSNFSRLFSFLPVSLWILYIYI